MVLVKHGIWESWKILDTQISNSWTLTNDQKTLCHSIPSSFFCEHWSGPFIGTNKTSSDRSMTSLPVVKLSRCSSETWKLLSEPSKKNNSEKGRVPLQRVALLAGCLVRIQSWIQSWKDRCSIKRITVTSLLTTHIGGPKNEKSLAKISLATYFLWCGVIRWFQSLRSLALHPWPSS